MRTLLDTSVLIADSAPRDVEGAISVVSITELHFGVPMFTCSPEDFEGIEGLEVRAVPRPHR